MTASSPLLRSTSVAQPSTDQPTTSVNNVLLETPNSKTMTAGRPLFVQRNSFISATTSVSQPSSQSCNAVSPAPSSMQLPPTPRSIAAGKRYAVGSAACPDENTNTSNVSSSDMTNSNRIILPPKGFEHVKRPSVSVSQLAAPTYYSNPTLSASAPTSHVSTHASMTLQPTRTFSSIQVDTSSPPTSGLNNDPNSKRKSLADRARSFGIGKRASTTVKRIDRSSKSYVQEGTHAASDSMSNSMEIHSAPAHHHNQSLDRSSHQSFATTQQRQSSQPSDNRRPSVSHQPSTAAQVQQQRQQLNLLDRLTTYKRKCQQPCISVVAGHYSMQGIRAEMEDKVTMINSDEWIDLLQRHMSASTQPSQLSNSRRTTYDCEHILDPKHPCKSSSFYAVFDGHGGDVSAEYCHQHVHHNMLASQFYGVEQVAALKHGLERTDAEFCAACRRIHLVSSSGTTAVTAYIECDLLVVGNVGDSRAVLCRSGHAVAVSDDHKPSRIEERERIEHFGGRVATTEEEAESGKTPYLTPEAVAAAKLRHQQSGNGVKEPQGCCACWQNMVEPKKPSRVFPGGLSVSRTIGDISMKSSSLVISTPEMFACQLVSVDEFLILACDGVWDVMNNQQAVDCVRKNGYDKDWDNAAKVLAKEAYKRGSSDNITVVIIVFRHPTTVTLQGETINSEYIDMKLDPHD